MSAHRPYTVAIAPNLNLNSPWRGLFTVRSQLPPVIYRVARYVKRCKNIVHLGRMEAEHIDASRAVSDFTALGDLFSRTNSPVPDLDGSVLTVNINPYTIEAVETHKRGPDKDSLITCQYHFHVIDKPSHNSLGNRDMAIWCHDVMR